MKRRFPFIVLLLLLLWGCGPGPKGNATPDVSDGTVLVDGVKVFTKSIGAGEPILVVHGGPGLDHSYLLPQMQGLAKNHQLIFYDQRCSGKSQAGLDSNQVTLAAFLKDIEAIRKHYKIEQLNLLGHSWGGLLSMFYAIEYPDHLQSLVLSNSMGGSSETRQTENAHLARKMTEDDAEALNTIQSSAAFAEGNHEAYEDFFRAMFRVEFHDREKADELTLALPEDIAVRSAELGLLYRDLAYYNVYEDLEIIKVPVLLIFGDEEPLSYLVAPKLEAAFPNSHLEIITECGHFPFIEKPQQYFKIIGDFIAQ